MHVLIIYAHPEPASFNASLLEAGVSGLRALGHSVEVSDLYRMKFDPVLKGEDFADRVDPSHFLPYHEALHAVGTGTFARDILTEMEKVRQADLLIFQFPLWFSSWPAIMKGWVDRVFQAGFAFRNDAMYENGLLRKKRAFLVITVGAPVEAYSDEGPCGDIRDLLLPITHASLESVGLTVLFPHLIFDVAAQTRERGAAEIERYRRRLLAL